VDINPLILLWISPAGTIRSRTRGDFARTLRFPVHRKEAAQGTILIGAFHDRSFFGLPAHLGDGTRTNNSGAHLSGECARSPGEGTTVRNKLLICFSVLTSCVPGCLYAQAWSGVLNSSRAIDWSNAGVIGGIPSVSWTQCGSTIAAYTGSASTINNAIAACGQNHYVQLGAGTFNLSDGISFWTTGNIPPTNVALRGMGADQTHLIFTRRSWLQHRRFSGLHGGQQ